MLPYTVQCLGIAAGAWLIACGTDHVTLRANDETLPDVQGQGVADSPPFSERGSPGSDLGVASPYPTLPSSRSEQGVPGLSPALLQPPAPICKIDFLFVIDDSSSMRDEQANLARSFPGFVQVMEQVIEAQDLHIMVVGTGGRREDDDDPALDPEQCDEVQGAGRRRSLDGVDCGLQTGLRYMVN